MRIGEAWQLRWTDVDFERKLIMLNKPEKKSKPRIFKVSNKLLGMLNTLPRNSERVFGNGFLTAKRSGFCQTRKRIARKVQNPRLEKITFHTLRHWKATMLYHETKDILYVMDFLGHREIKNTLLYVQLEKAIFSQRDDNFTVKIAKKAEEISSLLEVGFEYVCQKDGQVFLRKRK